MKNLLATIKILLSLLILLQVGYLTAQSNQYLHFDKTDDFVEVPEASKYIAFSNKISMVGWFYCDALAYGQGMFGFRNGGTGDGEMYIIQLNNGTLECRLILNETTYELVAPAGSIVAGTWQHVAWIYGNNKVKLYIDAVLVGSTSATGTFTSQDRPLSIGSHISPWNFYHGGGIDEFSLWSKALTATNLQNMMENELVGDEDGLELYYKFNQGVPEGDNTSITHLISEVEPDERNGMLKNFALTGNQSNFIGDLDPVFQAISFPQIPNKLITDPPFNLEAISSSNLSVTYEIISGPATVDGNLVTLTGEVGEVKIKSSQPGDDYYEPAEDVINTFQVLDPATHVPGIEARNPLAGDVFVPELSHIQLAAICEIAYPELFNVQEVVFEIDGETIETTNHENGHYTAWWLPPDYGSYNITIKATNNYSATATQTIAINIVDEAVDIDNLLAVEGVWLNEVNPSETVEAELPSYLGAFDQIVATLELTCPPTGGCGEWDRIASVDAKGHDGQWVEIFRYITPYGTACTHSIDLTDYMSILQGKIAFRLNCGTFDNGYVYNLKFDYKQGTPAHKYSSVKVMWQDTYQFGDPANLQPVEALHYQFPEEAVASTFKLVSSGHGWGNNNTGNAAEFHDDTHHIWINGVQTFEQRNWEICNPNPDGCSPQAGTWYHNRAGWCPGAIAKWFDYDMTPYVDQGNLEMKYIFDEDYKDNCHPNNPDCISEVTCPDCNDGFNPHLVVASNLVVFYDGPYVMTGTDELLSEQQFRLYPNPSSGLFNIELGDFAKNLEIRVINNLGQAVIRLKKKNTASQQIDLNNFPRGIYIVDVKTEHGRGFKKVVIE